MQHSFTGLHSLRAHRRIRKNTVRLRRSAWFAVTGSLALFACAWGNALDSNPSAWDPPESAVSASSDGEASTPVSACSAEPARDLTVAQSRPAAASHRAGEACLGGCHEAGGSAALAFRAAGTLYRAQGDHTTAGPDHTVQGVGGTSLVTDQCGNFYAVDSALENSPNQTQPWLEDPTFRRMDKPLARVAHAGDCNQAGCHDFSTRTNAGIFR